MFNFAKVVEGLYRGSAPTPDDVFKLANKYNINKIISLDLDCGLAIKQSCKDYNIQHLMFDIKIDDNHSLLKVLSYNLEDLLLNNGPTFLHCRAGKDRTGLICAIFRCKYQNWSVEKALQEARSFGFGIGLSDNQINSYINIIKASENHNDNNKNEDGTMVSNMRDNISNSVENRVLPSFNPNDRDIANFPYTYNELNNQDKGRNIGQVSNRPITDSANSSPSLGNYNNNAGMIGVGPTINVGGFL